MAKKFAEVLDEGVAAFQAGQDVKQVLLQFQSQVRPEQVGELRKLLETAFLLRQIPQVIPSPAAKLAGRERLLAAVRRKHLERTRRDGFWRTITRGLRVFQRVPEILQKFF